MQTKYHSLDTVAVCETVNTPEVNKYSNNHIPNHGNKYGANKCNYSNFLYLIITKHSMWFAPFISTFLGYQYVFMGWMDTFTWDI